MNNAESIEAAIDQEIAAAKEALPNASDKELTEWAMEHQHPSFTDDMRKLLAHEGIKELIRERAGELGVTLQE